MNSYNPFSLENKTILVTGASSGIGRAIAIECSKMGANVIITARNEQQLNETLSQMDEHSHQIIIADLNKDEDVEKIITSVPDLNGLVNCAGFTISKPFLFASKDDIRNVNDSEF